MRKYVKIIIGIGIFIILVVVIIFIFQDKANPEEISNSQVLEESAINTTLIIDYGDEKIERFDTEIKQGMNVFDLLKEETEKLNLALETKTYDMGIFIEAIGDKKNGQDGKYWMYYVNGEMPMVSADNLKINSGDKVEFKFEKSSF